MAWPFHHKHPLMWAAAMALLLRAMMPAGWMPSLGGDTGLVLVPCGGWAAAPKAATAHNEHHQTAGHSQHRPAPHDDHGKKADQPCAFASLGSAWTPTDGPSLISPPRLAPALTPARLSLTPGRGLAAPPPPATGPPSA